jgi:hypothetical protein
MTRALALTLVLGATACGGSTQPAEPPAAPPAPPAIVATPVTAGWTTTSEISAPESAYYDAASGFIFVSQIAGAADARDGNGRIAKLNGDGTVVNGSFLSGLNAPKGIRVCDGTLWTADLDEVIAADVATGAVKGRTKIAGAKFLNDVACAGDTAYVSDMFDNRIHAIQNGAASVVAEGDLEFPNGLLVDGDRLIVGGWGSQPKADFTTDVPGHLYAYDLKTKTKTLITPKPIGNIDGLEKDGRGGYVVTDHINGALLHVSAAGVTTLVKQLAPGASDIAFVPSSGIVIVPHMYENSVGAYDISAAIK